MKCPSCRPFALFSYCLPCTLLLHFAVRGTWPSQADLTNVPTEFDTLLDYQRIMSQLVLKETLAGVQQELTSKKSQRNVVCITGEVRPFPSLCFMFCYTSMAHSRRLLQPLDNRGSVSNFPLFVSAALRRENS